VEPARDNGRWDEAGSRPHCVLDRRLDRDRRRVDLGDAAVSDGQQVVNATTDEVLREPALNPDKDYQPQVARPTRPRERAVEMDAMREEGAVFRG
jgi:hypothetical protein